MRGRLPAAPSPDLQFLDYARDLAAARSGHRAIVFHLSRLKKSHRAEKNIETAAGIVTELVQEFSGRTTVLPGGDIALICKGISSKALNETIELVRYLFIDDEIAKEEEQADFCSVFDLEVAYPNFLALLQKIQGGEAKPPRRPPAPPAIRLPAPVGTGELGALLRAAATADLTGMLRRQTIWAVAKERPPVAKFDEVFIPIDALAAAIGTASTMPDNRCLSLYVAGILDKRLLARLEWETIGNERPLSINISVATARSAEFVAFDERRAAAKPQSRMVLQMSLVDICADLPAYFEAAELVKGRGYVICLDGIAYPALACMNFRRLRADLIKIPWDEALLQLGEAEFRELYRGLSDSGLGRAILTHCERREAIQFGQAVGIELFQGPWLDRHE